MALVDRPPVPDQNHPECAGYNRWAGQSAESLKHLGTLHDSAFAELKRHISSPNHLHQRILRHLNESFGHRTQRRQETACGTTCNCPIAKEALTLRSPVEARLEGLHSGKRARPSHELAERRLGGHGSVFPRSGGFGQCQFHPPEGFEVEPCQCLAASSRLFPRKYSRASIVKPALRRSPRPPPGGGHGFFCLLEPFAK